MFQKNYLKSLSFLSLAILSMFTCRAQTATTLSSPNKLIKVKVELKNRLQYSVSFNKETIIDNSQISLTLQDKRTLDKFKILNIVKSSVNEKWERV